MWKPEYAETRRRKYQESADERERRKSQGRTPEENKEYMRDWYSKNRERVKKYRRLNADARNARRRELYAQDAWRREKAKEEARKWRQENPEAHFANRLKKRGITPDDYRKMLKSQGGGCAVCGSADPGDSRGHRFHVDHCHSTGEVRGILCSPCNLGIGKFQDSPEKLESAAAYLREHQ